MSMIPTDALQHTACARKAVDASGAPQPDRNEASVSSRAHPKAAGSKGETALRDSGELVADQRATATTGLDWELLFNAVCEESFACVRILDRQGRIVRINAAGVGMLDVERAEDLLGKTLERFLTREARQAMATIWAQLRAGRSVHTAFPMVTAKGRRRWVESRMRPLFGSDGAFAGVLAISRDVTAEQRGRELQRREAQILRMIASQAPLVETLDALVRAVEELSDGMRATVLILDETDRRLRVAAAPNLPDEYNALVDGIEIGPRAGSCGTAAYRKQCVIVRDVLTDPLWDKYRDVGPRFGFRACWSEPILAENDRVLGTFALYYGEPREPTPFESELIQTAAFLAGIAIQQARLVEERQRQHEQLAHASRINLVGELVANIAHEINQPLYAIANFASACANVLQQPEPDLEQLRAWVTKIGRQAERGNDIIHRLKRFVRRQPLGRVPVSVAQVFSDALSLLGPLLQQHAVRVVVDPVPEEWRVVGDSVQLQQTLINLVQNAVRALSEARTPHPEVRIRCRADARTVVTEVADNGPGIAPEKRSAVFEPFYTTRSDGLGLGLSLSRSIIEHHGGRLELVDSGQTGCCFRITLPRARSRLKEQEQGRDSMRCGGLDGQFAGSPLQSPGRNVNESGCEG